MAGTIVTDRIETDASYASTLNVATSLIVTTGNVRIGSNNTSASSDEPLTVRTTTAAHNMSLVNKVAGSQAQMIIEGENKRYQIGVRNSGTSYANNFYLFAADTSRFTFLMNENGFVRLPYQPACKIHIDAASNTLDSGQALTSSIATMSKTNRDCFDRNGDFNTTNGRFTAPVDGLYFIGISFMRNGNVGNGSSIRFTKNGGSANIYARYYRPGHSWNYETSMLQTVTNLSAGDYIQITNTDGFTTSFYDDDSYFYAYLIN